MFFNIRYSIILGCIFFLLGCQQQATGWIEPGSNAARFVFGVAKTKHGAPLGNLPYLDVDPCSLRDKQVGYTVWRIQVVRYGPTPTIFVYGQSPKGYKTVLGPEPLKAGCYEVRGGGAYAFRFVVFSDGRVAEADVDGNVLKND